MDQIKIVRHIIETLFIVHTETKLNMICPVGIDPKTCYGLPYDREWHSHLRRPPIASNQSILSTIHRIKQLNQRELDDN